MDLNSHANAIMEDVDILVQMHMNYYKDSYLDYAKLKESEKYSLNGEFRKKIPLIDVKQMINKGFIKYDRKLGYDTLDCIVPILQKCGEDLQMSQERQWMEKGFDRHKLENKYNHAKDRPYTAANIIAGLGTGVGSAMFLGYILPSSNDVNMTALASISGTMIGFVGLVGESWTHILGKMLKPLTKVMMLDYKFRDMRGTSIYEAKSKHQCKKKLNDFLRTSNLEDLMRA